MITFKELESVSPKMTILPHGCSTNFWEELYQLFKQRMQEEETQSKGDE